MIKVFISYPGKPKKWEEFAIELKGYLNSYRHIEAETSPIKNGRIEDISLEVREQIKNSSYFVIIYPKICKENQFVNQELGYAFKLYENNELDIIVLWEDRKDIRGLMTPDTVRLISANQLTSKNSGNQPTPEKEELLKNIRKTILGGKMYPIQIIDCRIDNVLRKENRIDYDIKLIIDILPNKSLKDCAIEFVGPKPFNIDYKGSQAPLDVQEQGIFEHTHSSLIKFFKDSKITRRTFNLGELKGHRSYELLFHSYERTQKINYLYLGFYFVTAFGPKFYRVIVKDTVKDMGGLKLVLEWNEVSLTTAYKIPIERNVESS